ncbi:MAG: hypothetical protein OER85_17295, partial [Gammaproteobacteria bacterium]|nr:hypothetical protein [Gammaproteobacteria bacterium]
MLKAIRVLCRYSRDITLSGAFNHRVPREFAVSSKPAKVFGLDCDANSPISLVIQSPLGQQGSVFRGDNTIGDKDGRNIFA